MEKCDRTKTTNSSPKHTGTKTVGKDHRNFDHMQEQVPLTTKSSYKPRRKDYSSAEKWAEETGEPFIPEELERTLQAWKDAQTHS